LIHSEEKHQKYIIQVKRDEMMIYKSWTNVALWFAFLGLESISSFSPSFPAFSVPVQRTSFQRVRVTSHHAASSDDLQDEKMGLNELQTLLRIAVQREDYVEAGSLSDELFTRLYNDDMPKSDEEKRLKRRRMSWRGLGAAPWLVDRLDSLNFTFPTTIQINAMESVNKILNSTDDMMESTSLEERIDLNHKDMGIVISGSTGSGKTLAYLVPLLSTLSDSLFSRQRIRVGAEEKVGDTTGDLLERVSVVTSPVVRTNSRRPVRGGAIATGASLATLGKSGKDVKSALALVIVPTRELGVQTAMILYELIGGNVKKEATEIRGKANMFKYKGPKGIRIGCVLDDEEAQFGLKLQTDVAITMPQYLDKMIADGDLVPSKLRVVIYDEADLALENTAAEALTSLFDDRSEEREYTRLTLMVGASVTESLGSLAVRTRILPEGKSYIATATNHRPLLTSENFDIEAPSNLVGDQPKVASLKDLNVCLNPGLIHQRVSVKDEIGLLALARLLRKELEAYDLKKTDKSIQRPRVVVFFPDEKIAKTSIAPLRDALWGEHKLCVLLPKTGVNPLQMMEQFKRNETTVLLATPNSVRGLDFPDVSHVYTLYLPMDDPREYVHLAGRVGRVGQMGSVRGSGGRVISILKEEEADKMESLANDLGFEFSDIEINQDELVLPRNEDGEIDFDNVEVERFRQLFEDTLNLVSMDGDDEGDSSEASDPTVIDVDSESEDFQ
jgi:superfamily II DNA/RNA helicase